jgi:thermitase
MIYAADRGVDVISMSLGGRSNRQKQKAYVEAVKYANKAGAIVVAAAGNNGANAKDISPANVPGVITVSAINPENKKASFSNHLKNIEMGIAAPGQGIYSTIPNNKYASFNGTSMACPHVSGLVGIMKSLFPELNTQQAFDILDQTGIATKDGDLTGNLIQPHQAILELLD